MNWMFYLKTTETCNLNCKHCFTNGTSGRKIYWNPKNVYEWLKRFKDEVGDNHTAHCEFHGGEPFLVPVQEMYDVWLKSKDLWKEMTWGVTTNLTFKLTDDIIEFIKGPLKGRLGTSWDPDIRFANPKQYDLWRKNLKTLVENNFDIKLFISVTKGTINLEPIELLEWIRDLGVKEVSFERLTENGNANLHPEIFPTNIEQDFWFHKMHLQSEEYGCRDWFVNEFLENVYDKFEINYTKSGTFCRDCEEKIFTLNADETISGCPNSAPEFNFGHLKQNIKDILYHDIRINNIACEKNRDSRCYSCEVFNYCGGDCHQLKWQENVCPAPKTLMKHLRNNKKQKVIEIRKL